MNLSPTYLIKFLEEKGFIFKHLRVRTNCIATQLPIKPLLCLYTVERI